MTLLLSALRKLRFGVYRHVIHTALHCCFLSSGFCMFQPRPAEQHDACCAVMLPAAECSGFASGAHNTRSTSPSCLQISLILHPLACLWPLSLPEYRSWAREAALSTDRMNTLALYCRAVVQHTARHAARQHWPRWFRWGTVFAFSEPAKYVLAAVGIC